MKIYRLRDVNDESSRSAGDKGRGSARAVEGGVSVRGLRITDIKQGVKNPNRVNVFVDGEFSFSLDIAQVVDLKLKVGAEISETELDDYKRASEFGKLYQRALEWVLVRPRSEKEVRDYLYRKLRKSSSDALAPVRRYGGRCAPLATVVAKGFSEDFSEFFETIINRLVTKGYVDDRKFAEFWVENRFVKKGISRRRLELELVKKGVAKEIIEEVLAQRNDEEEIDKMIAKKRARYDDEKLISYLVRQGFSYQLAQSRVRGFGKD